MRPCGSLTRGSSEGSACRGREGEDGERETVEGGCTVADGVDQQRDKVGDCFF
jgi:hypothetical protein